MNLIQLQDRMKGLPDTALQTAANMPGEHQFLAMAELAERQRIRGAYANQAQQAQPTVAERIMGGNPVPPVESPRADIGGLAAASNRGDMQPALKMAQGGAVPSAYYMAAAGPVPSANAPPQETDVVEVKAPKQLSLPSNNIFNMMAGLGAFRNSGGYFAPMRDQYDERMDMYKQGVEQNLQANPYAAMIAAQDQDRARNAEMAKRDNWLALAQAGLGMAAGNSSDFLTNVAAGGQQGLAALRQGMTEAEKRQAALQQRGDLLQAAGSTIEGNNAAAMRGLYGAGFTSGTAMDRDIYTQAGGALREELTREANIAEAARERGFRGSESAAERASRLLITRINEAGATTRAKFQEQYRMAADDRQRDIALQRALAEVPQTISKMIADRSLPPTEAANAIRALREQLYADAGKTPPASIAAALPGRNRGEKSPVDMGQIRQ